MADLSVITLPIGNGASYNLKDAAAREALQNKVGNSQKATSSTLGLVRIGYAESGRNYAVQLDNDGKMYVNVPWTDHTYTVPTKVSELTNDSGYTTNTGTVTQVKVGTTAYNPSSGVVSLPAYPTTLPASDVYAWAKASNKPSYTLDEVSDGSTRKLANYLPLSGGAMTGTIISNDTTTREILRIGSVDKDTTIYRVHDTLTYKEKGAYGFSLKYLGTGGGMSNALALYADNLTASEQVEVYKVIQDGTISFGKTIIGSISGNAATASAVAWSGVTDKPASFTPSSHTHGNIQNGGTLQTNDITIANGDKLVVTDASDSNKVARTSIAFDGSTTNKCLTQKGTWEAFTNTSGTVTKVSTGVGLTGGDVTTTGTVKAKLRSETALTLDSSAATTTSGRVYPVAVDKTGYLAVNVPWTDHTYTVPTKVSELTNDAGYITSYTDNKVTQTASSTNAYYEILFSGTADNTERTEAVKKSSDLTYNPYFKLLQLPGGSIDTQMFTSYADGYEQGYMTSVRSGNNIHCTLKLGGENSAVGILRIGNSSGKDALIKYNSSATSNCDITLPSSDGTLALSGGTVASGQTKSVSGDTVYNYLNSNMYVLLASTDSTSYVKTNISDQYAAYVLVCGTTGSRVLATSMASHDEALVMNSSNMRMELVFFADSANYVAECYFVVSGNNITGAYLKSKSIYDRAKLYGLIKI